MRAHKPQRGWRSPASSACAPIPTTCRSRTQAAADSRTASRAWSPRRWARSCATNGCPCAVASCARRSTRDCATSSSACRGNSSAFSSPVPITARATCSSMARERTGSTASMIGVSPRSRSACSSSATTSRRHLPAMPSPRPATSKTFEASRSTAKVRSRSAWSRRWRTASSTPR